ncbi:hypothetical protein EIE93_09215, partial [Campylobacter coli]|nr:hypothetical protein [Campylobacter coli]
VNYFYIFTLKSHFYISKMLNYHLYFISHKTYIFHKHKKMNPQSLILRQALAKQYKFLKDFNP